VVAEEKTFVFEDWLADGIKGMKENLRQKRHRESSTFRRHMRSAGKEMLLATRSLFDKAIEYLENEPEPKKKATKIKIQ